MTRTPSALLVTLLLSSSACSLSVRLDGKPAGVAEPAGDGDVEGPEDGPGGSDAGPPELLPGTIFRDDFERENGPLSPPWFDVGLGTPRVAYGQLCMDAGESASVKLGDGRYGYARVDVTGGWGLEWSLEDRMGPIVTLNWNGEIAASTGEHIGQHGQLSVRSVEVRTHDATKTAQVRVDRGPWVDVALPGVTTDFSRMRFSVNGRVETETEQPRACFDNVYAGPAEPAMDPFADAPARVGYFTDDQQALCIFEHCPDETLACLEWPWQDDCPDCDCRNTFGRAVSCAVRSPDGTVSHCFRESESAITAALVGCADQHCSVDPLSTPVTGSIANSGTSPSDQFPGKLAVLIAYQGGIASATVDVATGERSVEHDLPFLGTPTGLRFYASWSHEVQVAHGVDSDEGLRVFGQFHWWYDEPTRWQALELDHPIDVVRPYPGGAWVETTAQGSPPTRTRHVLSLSNDGEYSHWTTLYRQTDPEGAFDDVSIFIPQSDERTAYAVLHGKRTGRLLAATTHELTPYVEDEWYVTALFTDGFVYTNVGGHGDSRIFLSLENEETYGSFPAGRMAGPYLMGWADLWITGGDALTRVATLPSAIDRAVDTPVASDVQRVLFQTSTGWLLSDSQGEVLRTYTPAAVPGDGPAGATELVPSRTVPVSIACGLLVSTRATPGGLPLTALDAYSLDAEGLLAIERVDLLEAAPEAVQIAARPGLLAWQNGRALRAFACSTKAVHTAELPEAIIALLEYTPIAPHTFPPLPQDPDDDFH